MGRPGQRQARRRRLFVIYGMLAPAVLGIVIFFVYPLIASVYYSFTSYNLLSDPVWVGLRNYQYLFTEDPNVGTAALNTLWFVIIMVPVKLAFAFAVAGLLARARRGNGVWRTLYYLPALVPPVASVVAFVFLFNPGTGPINLILGWLGVHPGPLWFNDPGLAKPSLLILSMWVMGDIMIIFLAGLLDVPRELYEASSLDGANGAQKLRYVTFPAMVPVLVFALVTGVIAALQYFTEASVASDTASGEATVGGGGSLVAGYPDQSLLTYTQWLYERGFEDFQLGYASALAVLLFIVASIFLVVLLRKVRAFMPEEATV
ncbi:MAG TPA: sugar ABC transporter permease [Galbitalea sp.]|nr:sugar ABC transporter permease [Galbitalea sp.]